MGHQAAEMLIIFTPIDAVKEFVTQKYGPVTYAALGENESLGGLISTRDVLLKARSNGQRYEFGTYGRPVLDSANLSIEILSASSPLPETEKVKRRKTYIESSRISGPKIDDYSLLLGEWGDNPRTELRTRKIREIYVLCNGCQIPLWICDTLEPVLNWGENSKSGVQQWLNENCDGYLGLPLYKIPPVNFSQFDLSEFPETERALIEAGKLDKCTNLAEQNIVLLQEACEIFGLKPLLIDQRKLRDAGAYVKGTDVILKNLESLSRRFGDQNLFRVECPQCGKYIYDVDVTEGKVRGKCSGQVRSQIEGEFRVRYEGCGNDLEENLDYLYQKAMPNGKILTAIYMSNSEVGIFFPDVEFVPENVVAGSLERMILTTGEIFNSGIPTIVQTGWFTKDGNVENIFDVLDSVPAEIILERFMATPSNRRIDMKACSIESQLLTKLREYALPADPKLIADILFNLRGTSIDMDKLGLSKDIDRDYLLKMLRGLGKVRQNRIITSRPTLSWSEDYTTFMDSIFVSESEVGKLRTIMVDPNAAVRTILETGYLVGLVK